MVLKRQRLKLKKLFSSLSSQPLSHLPKVYHDMLAVLLREKKICMT
jgi:hypothetical protein